MTIDVNDESGEDVDAPRLAELARFVLDAATMATLNVRWMDEQGPTDVLSFPMDELRPGSEDREPEPGLLGDVVLCPAVARTQAAAAGHSTEEELDLLCTHGILHLLGYDHAEPDDERAMFGRQGELLAGWQRSRMTGNPT